MKKRLICILLALVLVLCLCACGGSKAPSYTYTDPGQKLRHAEITIRDYGTIKLELDEGVAPITVENFVELANQGFYNGLTFHRIIDGFMIQGGDPHNGVKNPISHVKGVLSMARSDEYDSGSSQFFITVADSTFLDGHYAAFGKVTEGVEIAEQIAKDAKPIDDNGTIPPEAQPVIESVVITD